MKKLMYVLLFAALCTAGKAFEFNRVSAGLVSGARISYVSSSAIKLDVGYGEILGSYWEIGSTDSLVTTGYSLTGLSSTTYGVFQYIYIDQANSSLPDVTLKNSTTAPTWSSSLLGWYNGSDRCIGAVWIKPNGTLQDFTSTIDGRILCKNVLYPVVASGTPTGSWITVSAASTGIPVNAAEVFVEGYATSNNTAKILIGPSENREALVVAEGYKVARSLGWLYFSPGASKSIDWFGNSDGLSTVLVNIYGFRISR